MYARIVNLDISAPIAAPTWKTPQIFTANRSNVATTLTRASGRNGVPTR